MPNSPCWSIHPLLVCLLPPQSSGQQIPVVVESCIRFINLHGESLSVRSSERAHVSRYLRLLRTFSGLHHEGIFRVPGSQREVNLIRDAFERGALAPNVCLTTVFTCIAASFFFIPCNTPFTGLMYIKREISLAIPGKRSRRLALR